MVEPQSSGVAWPANQGMKSPMRGVLVNRLTLLLDVSLLMGCVPGSAANPDLDKERVYGRWEAGVLSAQIGSGLATMVDSVAQGHFYGFAATHLDPSS